MTIKDALNTYVRVELADELATRWKDSDLLVFFQQAVRRMNAIGQRNELPFMRAKIDTTLAKGSNTLQLPADFFTPLGIWRLDQHRMVNQVDVDEYENIISTGALSVWVLDGDQIEFKDAADHDTDIRLRYFVDYRPQSLTLASQIPWDDKLTMIICDYAKLRARNVDDYALTQDMGLLRDMENQILNAYTSLTPDSGDAVGVFTL